MEKRSGALKPSRKGFRSALDLNPGLPSCRSVAVAPWAVHLPIICRKQKSDRGHFSENLSKPGLLRVPEKREPSGSVVNLPAMYLFAQYLTCTFYPRSSLKPVPLFDKGAFRVNLPAVYLSAQFLICPFYPRSFFTNAALCHGGHPREQ